MKLMKVLSPVSTRPTLVTNTRGGRFSEIEYKLFSISIWSFVVLFICMSSSYIKFFMLKYVIVLMLLTTARALLNKIKLSNMVEKLLIYHLREYRSCMNYNKWKVLKHNKMVAFRRWLIDNNYLISKQRSIKEY